METRKVLVIFGTRPEAIKMVPIIKELRKRPEQFICEVCVTSQHREMLEQVLTLFELRPDYDLNIMAANQTLADVTSRALQGLDSVIRKSRPALVLVQGDTTTAFCGALCAFYNKVKVGHVEAGLRTGDRTAPFPEEANRRLVTQVTDYHFAPTPKAKSVLIGEQVPADSIFITGNTVIDSLLWARELVRQFPPSLPGTLLKAIGHRELVLITGHRRESFGEAFENICYAIREVADRHPHVTFVYPVHLNPNVQEPVNRILRGHERIHLSGPLSYAPFVWLMDRASVVLTDSGGVQEEAPSLGKPVLVMREITERPEGIAAGNARLVGVRRESIVDALSKLLSDPTERMRMSSVKNPYGDGLAGARIVDILMSTKTGGFSGKRKTKP